MKAMDCHIDFETFCDLDLKEVGVHRYVRHPSFRPLCMAYRIPGQSPFKWVWGLGDPRQKIQLPAGFDLLLQAPECRFHAWNAAFETAVLAMFFTRSPVEPISCTMQRALAYGLPGRLANAAAALGVAQQKDMAGHRLMLKMTKPGKAGPYPATDADMLRLADYCAQDVETEMMISAVIPPLQPREEKLSRIDRAMNDCGVPVDLPTVIRLKELAALATVADAARGSEITGGYVPNAGTQAFRLVQWVNRPDMGDAARATVEKVLQDRNLPTDVREVLDIRLRLAKASTKKLERMWAVGGLDGVLRGQFQFCGAGRTGRWSGRLVQVQNLPRVPKGFNVEGFLAAARAVGGYEDLDKVSPGPVLDCISKSLRACLVPGRGQVMYGFDFSQIEARVLAWLAGQQDILDVFARGEDVYVWAAAQFGSKDRQLGKVLVLALGYGMGEIKLRETAAEQYGVLMTPTTARDFKEGWRDRNRKIVAFWYDMERAAVDAVMKRGQVFAVGGSGVSFQCTRRTLQMRLPSGRILYYHAPEVTHPAGTLTYKGTEAGGAWGLQRTWGGKLAENATQAVARDIMAEAMERIFDHTGRIPMMTVHDELVYGVAAPDGPLSAVAEARVLEAYALISPAWAGGLPIAGESKLMRRYGVSI